MVEEKTIGLPSILRNTLELVNGDDFSAGDPEELPADDEKVIGEMTAFEKACSVIVKTSHTKAKEIHENDGVPEEGYAVQEWLRRAKAANDLKWFSIRERLGEGCPGKIATRSEWKIVEVKKDEDDCNCPACQFRRAMSGSGGAMIVGVGIGG